MNHGLKLRSGNANSEQRQNIPEISMNTRPWTFGKERAYPQTLPQNKVENEILNILPSSVLNELSPIMEEVFLTTGEYLYKPDDEINYLYFPETAILSDFQILEDGKTLEVAMIGREGVAGVASIFNSHLSPNWLQVSIPGKAIRINSNVFRQELKKYQLLQSSLFKYVSKYIAQISQKVICNSHHSVEERLCCWFLMISDRCKRTNLPLTQEQIAGFLGVHRPSITLISQSLREKGIINYLRGKIFILDKVKLEFAACECYSTIKIM